MLSPLISILGPAVYLSGAMVRLYSISLYAFYMCLVGISVFPMMHALLTITFVGPYRRFTAQWMKAIVKGDLRAATQQQSTATPPTSKATRMRNTFFSIKGNLRIEVLRRHTVFGAARNDVYPAH